MEFHCGKAEDVFPNVLGALVSPNVTAIVDPPRAGLREWTAAKTRFLFLCLCVWFYRFSSDSNADSKVILAIRRAEHLKRLVYVACNAKAAMNNFIE